MATSKDDRVTAAVLIIGDEILSGRTQDTNLRDIAKYLGVHGVDLAEARTVPDVHEEIIAALDALRARYDYVITTGGIGPTHDDITADCVAEAFGLQLYEHPEIIAMMTAPSVIHCSIKDRSVDEAPSPSFSMCCTRKLLAESPGFTRKIVGCSVLGTLTRSP